MKLIFKSILIMTVLTLLVSFYGVYSARALPNWFDESTADSDYATDAINKALGNNGANLLAQKSLGILRGRVSFNEDEFNALFLASLKADADGRKLLAVSDGVRTFLRDGEIEVSAVVNLNKLEKVEPKARKAIESFDKLFWIIEDGRIAVTLFGTPVVRRGGIGVKDNFHAKIGEITFSNDTLRSLNVPVERANNEELAIKYLSLTSINVTPDNIQLGVRPKI